MKKIILIFTINMVVLWNVSCKKNYDEQTYPTTPTPVTITTNIISVAGDSTGISAKLDEFRLVLGATLNTAPGAIGGRREVNWDAVPASLTNANTFPSDFFGQSDPALPNGRKRGLIMTNSGTSFRVDSTDFSDIDASYVSEFNRFSPKKLFTYLGNNVTECTFKVPGSTIDGFIKGFGIIFNDVDAVNSSYVEFFNGSKSLGIYSAKTATSGQFSFLGVYFPDEKITKLKITAGNGLLATGVKDISNGGTKDLVVMDDFLYDEPKAQ